jgi:hypothetical protein
MTIPSGDSTWTLQQQQIINAAFRKIGVLVDGASYTTTQYTGASEALNNLVFSLYAMGMPLWAINTTFFTLTEGQTAYNVGQFTNTIPPGGTQPNLAISAPLKILQAWSRDMNSETDIPMNIYTQYNYNLLSTKINQGYPVHLWYQPFNQSGTITIWPAPDSYSASNRVIYFTYQRAFNQFDAITDGADFPQVWLEPLIYSLAHRLSPEYGLPLSEQDKLNETANALIENALSFGTEEGSFFIQPDWVVMGMGQGNPNGY